VVFFARGKINEPTNSRNTITRFFVVLIVPMVRAAFRDYGFVQRESHAVALQKNADAIKANPRNATIWLMLAYIGNASNFHRLLV
jgi:hypothetical protein